MRIPPKRREAQRTLLGPLLRSVEDPGKALRAEMGEETGIENGVSLVDRKNREFKGSVRCTFHRETRENREQKNGVSPVDLKRFKVESKKRFTLPQEREPKAVKEEEVLVRAVRVVRGLGF